MKIYSTKRYCVWCGGRWFITSNFSDNPYKKTHFYHRWCYPRHLIVSLECETPQTFECELCGRTVKEKMASVEDCPKRGMAQNHVRKKI